MKRKNRISSAAGVVKNVLCLFILASVSSSLLNAQQTQAPSYDLSRNVDVLGCDEGLARQDIVVSEALNRLKEDAVLFVILRPGKSESSAKLVEQRLFNVTHYFSDGRAVRLDTDKKVLDLPEQFCL